MLESERERERDKESEKVRRPRKLEWVRKMFNLVSFFSKRRSRKTFHLGRSTSFHFELTKILHCALVTRLSIISAIDGIQEVREVPLTLEVHLKRSIF